MTFLSDIKYAQQRASLDAHVLRILGEKHGVSSFYLSGATSASPRDIGLSLTRLKRRGLVKCSERLWSLGKAAQP